MKTIHEAVAIKIQGCGEAVINTVVDKLAQIEIDKRISIVTMAFNKIEDLKKELKKIDRNDNITYIDGKKVESMTSKRFDEIEKMKQTIVETESKLKIALDKNTEEAYLNLSKLNGNSKNEDKSEDSK